MKKKKSLTAVVTAVCIAALAACYVAFTLFPDGFGMPMDYRIAHFGIKYAELYTFQTEKEREIGETIAARALACMEYKGNEESAEETDGLSYFYYFSYYERPAESYAKVQPVKCAVLGGKGSVWIKYSIRRYDEGGELIFGAQDILARCAIEKNSSGEWQVTDISLPS